MPENAPKVEDRQRASASARRSASARPTSPRARRRAPRCSARPARRWSIRSTIARVIAGQGTAALELLEDVPDLDASSRRSAAADCCRAPRSPRTRCDPGSRSTAPSRRTPTTRRASFAIGQRRAGGLDARRSPTACARTLSPRTLRRAARARRRRSALAARTAIVAAMRMIWERMKIVIEPSSAVPLAACSRARSTFAGSASA